MRNSVASYTVPRWDDHRDELADPTIAVVDKCAPGFKDSALGRQVLTPMDLERTFGAPCRSTSQRTADAGAGRLSRRRSRPVSVRRRPTTPAARRVRHNAAKIIRSDL